MNDEAVAQVTEEIDVERFVRVWRKIRAARKELAKAFKAQDDDLKGKQEIISTELLAFLNRTNQKSARTNDGTVYKQKEMLPSCSDWSAFYAWIKENDAFDFLHKRITVAEVARYMEDNEDGPPPGVRIMESWVIRIRKDGEKDDD